MLLHKTLAATSLCIALQFFSIAYAQVSINSDGSQPHPSAQLEVKANNKGLLLPRVADPATAINTPAEGLIAYNSNTHQPAYFNGNEWATMSGQPVSRFTRVHSFIGGVSLSPNYTDYSWTVPAGINEIWVEMWAGGDAGFKMTTPFSSEGGSVAQGGDAGDYASLLLPVTPGQVLAIRTGAGGGSTNYSGGNTSITTTAKFEVGKANYLYINNVAAYQVPGLLLYVAGGEGTKGENRFDQSGATTFRMILAMGSGGDAYPRIPGGDGVTLQVNAATGIPYPPGVSSYAAQDGSTPGAGGGSGFNVCGRGGAGMLIIHY